MATFKLLRGFNEFLGNGDTILQCMRAENCLKVIGSNKEGSRRLQCDLR